MLGFVFIAVVKKKDAGTDEMKEIAGAIQEGADAFIKLEYKVIFWIAILIAVLLTLVVSWQSAVSFILGAVMSASAGWVGMKIATLSNVVR